MLQRLVTGGWLCPPGTVSEVMASRSEDPTAVTVPTLLPPSPARSLSARPPAPGSPAGPRKSSVTGSSAKKLGAATRLLVLYTAAHARPDGRLGHSEDGGLNLDQAAAFTALPPEEVAEHAGLLITADWLAETNTAEGKLRGQLTERILPLRGLL
ncbi:hypothetical protein ACFQ10_12520 [Streptomyces indonesiensis]